MKKNRSATDHKTSKLTGAERQGLVIATFGATADIEAENGQVIRCHLRKNAEPIVTGDHVLWLPENNHESGIVAALLPRKSLLGRPENAHKIKPIAANIDAIVIVNAPPPVLSEDMIDRYLVAAENLTIQPVILLNKDDLLDEAGKKNIAQRLQVYKNLGYTIIFSNIFTADGLKKLREFLAHKTCVLVGASGVGKSSIIAALTHEQSISIGEVSATTGLGKHTTTGTRLYHLPDGGNLIDSPGVREFGLWNASPEEVLNGFVELKSLIGECKFRDCHHQTEPGCAVQEALQKETVSAERFKSYEQIVAGLGQKARVRK